MSQSQRVSFFIEDFARHVSNSIVGVENMAETAELAGEIVRNSRNIAAALEIYETERDVKRLIISKAESEIRAYCARRNWAVEGDLEAGDGSDYLLILFSPQDTWGFGFSFHKANYKTLFYGLARRAECDARRKPKPDLIARLDEVRRGRGDIEWPWWLNPEPHDCYFPHARDWAGTKDFWVAVDEGGFASNVVGFVEAMHAHLRKSKMLEFLR